MLQLLEAYKSLIQTDCLCLMLGNISIPWYHAMASTVVGTMQWYLKMGMPGYFLTLLLALVLGFFSRLPKMISWVEIIRKARFQDTNTIKNLWEEWPLRSVEKKQKYHIEYKVKSSLKLYSSRVVVPSSSELVKESMRHHWCSCKTGYLASTKKNKH